MFSVALCATLGASIAACSRSEGGSEPDPIEVPATVASIQLSVVLDTLKIGSLLQASATARDAKGATIPNAPLQWTSTVPAVATVSANGEIRAIAPGSTIISVKSGTQANSGYVIVPIAGDIYAQFAAPTPGTMFGDSVPVKLVVTSKYQIVSLTARVGSLTIPLDLSKFDSNGPARIWNGAVRTPGLQGSAQTLSITATDANGSSSEATIALKHDLPPVITIVSPTDRNQVFLNNVPIKVNCTDAENPCAAIDVFSGNEGYLIASGTTSIDAVIPASSLQSYNNWIFRARDSAGQFTRVNTFAPIVLNNPKLEIFATVPGTALDVRGTRVAYADNSGTRGALRIRTIGAGETTVLDSANVAFTYGYLTPAGLLFKQGPPGANSIETSLRDFRGTTIENLDGFSVVQTSGAFAIYYNRDIPAHTLQLRDLTRGVTQSVASNVGNASVSANGHVAYSSLLDHQVYLDGTLISNKPGFWAQIPETDGTRVVYYRCSKPVSPLQNACTPEIPTAAQTILYEAGQETALADFSGTPFIGGFRVVNGWLFYAKRDATGSFQIWSYSPTGVQKQISNFNGSSGIEAVGDNGELVFSNNNEFYVSKPPYSANISIGSIAPVAGLPGKLFWRDADLFTLLGGTVFRVKY